MGSEGVYTPSCSRHTERKRTEGYVYLALSCSAHGGPGLHSPNQSVSQSQRATHLLVVRFIQWVSSGHL